MNNLENGVLFLLALFYYKHFYRILHFMQYFFEKIYLFNIFLQINSAFTHKKIVRLRTINRLQLQ